MKILVAHNRYRRPGGEDAVFEREANLLAASGHEVRKLVISNDVITSNKFKLLTALRTVENPFGIAAMSRALEDFKPDVVHIHNFFPLLSPAVYKVCRHAGSAVVQTLHNYRTICASALLMRNGRVCHLCVNGSPLWGLVHRCYRGSVVGSAALARMIAVHRKRQTWSTDVDRFIALSEFGRRIFIEAGFPGDRVDVKPNFIEDPGDRPEGKREGVLFVGRLAEEKGVRYLVEAAVRYRFPLRVAGDGPELATLRSLAHSNVNFLGQLSPEAVLSEMRRAMVLVIPSIWYEGFPMAVVEAFASGTPVIASRLGSLAEIIEDGVTGFHVGPGEVDNLGECIQRLLSDTDLARHLGHMARQAFINRYTPRSNLGQLESIYQKAVETRRSHA
jgi:glycosyltransferase involved in cell wall biosynthesis